MRSPYCLREVVACFSLPVLIEKKRREREREREREIDAFCRDVAPCINRPRAIYPVLQTFRQCVFTMPRVGSSGLHDRTATYVRHTIS